MKIEEDFVFPVYLTERILNVINKKSKKYDLEVFGYLVGEIFSWKDVKYVLIKDHLFVKAGTDSQQYTVSQIEGSAGKYEEKFQNLKRKRKNDNLRIVGWWHSHPNFGCFLSQTDLDTQKYFFYESYQLALVIDPIRDEYNIFSLDNNSEKGYKPIEYAVISTL